MLLLNGIGGGEYLFKYHIKQPPPSLQRFKFINGLSKWCKMLTHLLSFRKIPFSRGEGDGGAIFWLGT